MYCDNKKLRYILLGKSLLAIYKVFLKLLIDYRDAIYDQTFNSFFCEKLESAQDKKALAITSVIPGTSRAKFFKN